LGVLQKNTDPTFVWGRILQMNGFLFGDEEKRLIDLSRPDINVMDDLLKTLRSESDVFDSARILCGWSGLIGRIPDLTRSVLKLDSNDRSHFVGGYNGYGIAAAVRSGCVARHLVEGRALPSDFPLQISPFEDLSAQRSKFSCL
jgi:glycine/D-amino acid oxidase-like deaminating enzyme